MGGILMQDLQHRLCPVKDRGRSAGPNDHIIGDVEDVTLVTNVCVGIVKRQEDIAIPRLRCLDKRKCQGRDALEVFLEGTRRAQQVSGVRHVHHQLGSVCKYISFFLPYPLSQAGYCRGNVVDSAHNLFLAQTGRLHRPAFDAYKIIGALGFHRAGSDVRDNLFGQEYVHNEGW